MGGIDVAGTLAPLALMRGDPTVRFTAGRFERATLTPDGPGALTATWAGQGAALAEVTATGDGAAWLLARAPRLLGATDDVRGFEPSQPSLQAVWRRHQGLRMTATGTLWHDLAWTIVQQRVHRNDAAAQWRRLVLELGAPAGEGLLTPPEPRAVARLGYADLHRFGIERQRAEYLIAAARVAGRLGHLPDGPLDAALPALRSLPGVGAWTGACLSAFTWGHADTVVLGDAGIPSMVTWLLAREPRGDDARMLELLEPYRPHRYRLVKLAFAARSFPPRPRTGGRTDIRRL